MSRIDRTTNKYWNARPPTARKRALGLAQIDAMLSDKRIKIRKSAVDDFMARVRAQDRLTERLQIQAQIRAWWDSLTKVQKRMFKELLFGGRREGRR